jgi:hypothetical protein
MSDIELKIRSRDIATLLNTIRRINPDYDLAVIQKAYLFASARS